MAPARRARIVASPSDPGSDHDTDVDTPKPPSRQHIKKRLSEAYIPDADASFVSESGGRAPLRPVNMNDDAAEKRRRRKSMKIAVLDNAHAGPSSEANIQDPTETSRMTKQKQQLTSVADSPAIDVPFDVMNSNYEEWMKMATDNKINAANSWNFALIDYFHDMSLLRNNTDNSINFQRASCTLDSCVKIWTSRVDSVGTETAKLVSNLASEGKEGNDEDAENSDNPDADPSQPRKRKAVRSESTLAKNPAQLRSKKLDLEFSVDPLFKKTCADFDEGGAQGLLMNHLNLGVGSEGGLRVVFDASDSMGKVEEEEDIPEPEDEVDLSYLRKEFLPDLTVLNDKAISHSLAEFSFSKDTFTFDESTFLRDNTPGNYDDDDDVGGGGGGDFPMGGDEGVPVEDFFVGDHAVADDMGAEGGGDDYDGDNQSHSNGSVGADEGGGSGGFVPFDPRRAPNERDLVMAMTDADGDGGMLDYFDQNFLKNWAGPEHWKLRKVVRRPDTTDAASKAKPRREKKEAFKIDFLTPPDPEKSLKTIGNELFAPVTRGVGINLPGTGTAAKKSKRKIKDEKRDDHRLPDDMHFTSRQLVTLFLKPKFSLKMRGQRVRYNEGGDGEVDENFWAQAAANQATGQHDEEGDETANGGAIPFNTQFFHDDYDDGPGFDDADAYDGDGVDAPDVDAGEQDLLAATQGQARRVRPEFVNYAKRAKRVDVRKLKENIWKGLNIVVHPKESESDARDVQMDVDIDLPPATDPSEARVFSSVISGLQKSYPREKMEEISTSFCFICLLHLANEQGLKLESTAEGQLPEIRESLDADEAAEDKQIGNIWNLKIYRDPDATQSA